MCVCVGDMDYHRLRQKIHQVFLLEKTKCHKDGATLGGPKVHVGHTIFGQNEF